MIKRRPDRAYDFVNEKGEVHRDIVARRSAATCSSAQAKPDKDKPDYGYVVFRVAGNEALLHYPQCNDQDKAMLATFGVEVRGQYECMHRPRRRSDRAVQAARSRRADVEAGARVARYAALHVMRGQQP